VVQFVILATGVTLLTILLARYVWPWHNSFRCISTGIKKKIRVFYLQFSFFWMTSFLHLFWFTVEKH